MTRKARALALRPEIDARVPDTAFVMAAGLGKRMRPLTASRPKPLVEVAGKALIDHVLDRLRSAGVGKIVVNVHYLADALEAHLTSRAKDFDVRISDERKQLMETGEIPTTEGQPSGRRSGHSLWNGRERGAR